VRPLLGCWREEIDAYVAAHGLEFCEDASNADSRHARNRLRHEALPKLREAAGRRIDLAVWRAVAVLAGENDYFETLPEVREIPDELTVRRIRGLHEALQRRVIHGWLRKHAIESIGFAEVEAVRGLIEREAPAKVNLPGGLHARRRAGKIFISRGELVKRRDADSDAPPGL
jgi:tRNA(Ile)-lysidine synthase